MRKDFTIDCPKLYLGPFETLLSAKPPPLSSYSYSLRPCRSRLKDWFPARYTYTLGMPGSKLIIVSTLCRPRRCLPIFAKPASYSILSLHDFESLAKDPQYFPRPCFQNRNLQSRTRLGADTGCLSLSNKRKMSSGSPKTKEKKQPSIPRPSARYRPGPCWLSIQ